MISRVIIVPRIINSSVNRILCGIVILSDIEVEFRVFKVHSAIVFIDALGDEEEVVGDLRWEHIHWGLSIGVAITLSGEDIGAFVLISDYIGVEDDGTDALWCDLIIEEFA